MPIEITMYPFFLFTAGLAFVSATHRPPFIGDEIDNRVRNWNRCADFFLNNCHEDGVLESTEFKRLCGGNRTSPAVAKAVAIEGQNVAVGCIIQTWPKVVADKLLAKVEAGGPGGRSMVKISLLDYKVPIKKVTLKKKRGRGIFGEVKTKGVGNAEHHLVFRAFLQHAGNPDCLKLGKKEEKPGQSLVLDFEDICT